MNVTTTFRLGMFCLALLCSGNLWAQPEPAPPPPPQEEIFRVVEEMPRFPGCEEVTDRQERESCSQEKLLNFIFDNLQYPALARENDVEGTVVVSFIVEKNGSLSNIRIVRDIGAGCGHEAERIIGQMNSEDIRWIPGKQRGRARRVQFNMPIRFELSEPPQEEAPQIVEIPDDALIMEEVDEPVYFEEEAPPPPPMRAEEEIVEYTVAEEDTPPPPPTIEEDAPIKPRAVEVAPPPPPPPPPPPAQGQEEIFVVVEDMPLFPGCEDTLDRNERKNCAQEKMLAYIYENLDYPAEAREAGITGTTVIQFVVDTDGTLDNITILRDIGGGCGQAGADVIEQMNEEEIRWIPGKQRGVPVKVRYNIPIRFRI